MCPPDSWIGLIAVSPRKTRKVRPAAPSAPLGPERIEDWPDGDWIVRPVPGAAATKPYRCPGCDQELYPGSRTWWCGRLTRARRRGGTGIRCAGSAACSAGPAAVEITGRTKTHVTDIRATTVLPARRAPITLTTADGLRLIGELALPADRDPAGTLVCLHPLPTHGGMMDSHVYRKAAARLPALADLAVLRFNTRGTIVGAGQERGRVRRRRDRAARRRGRGRLRGRRWPAGHLAARLVVRHRADPASGACCPASPAASCSHRRCAGPPTRTWTAGPPRPGR